MDTNLRIGSVHGHLSMKYDSCIGSGKVCWGQLITDIILAMWGCLVSPWVIEMYRGADGDGIVLSTGACLHGPILAQPLSPPRWRMKSLLPMSAQVRALHLNEVTQEQNELNTNTDKQGQTFPRLILNNNKCFFTILHSNCSFVYFTTIFQDFL